jgi:mRNA export factor
MLVPSDLDTNIFFLLVIVCVSRGNFSFKCHREGAPAARDSTVFAVNAISFHPVFGTFATAGSDGGITFWDKDSKQKLKVFTKKAGPIPAATFNRTGTIYAYAVSYDWSKVIFSGTLVDFCSKTPLSE